MFVQQVQPNVSGISIAPGGTTDVYDSFPMHLHTEAEFLQITGGKFICHAGEKTLCGSTGDIIMVNRNVPHSTEYFPGSTTSMLQIDIEKFLSGSNKKLRHLSSFLNENKNPAVLFKSADSLTAELNCCFENMKRELTEVKTAYQIMIKSEIYRIIGLLYRGEIIDDYFSQLDKDSLEKLMPALLYIDEHFTEEISLEKISGTVHLNAQYFSRLFKKITGRNVSDYITYLRVCRAQNLLSKTEKTILEIAYDSGYSSISNFNKSFCRATGCTPSHYRKIKTEGI